MQSEALAWIKSIKIWFNMWQSTIKIKLFISFSIVVLKWWDFNHWGGKINEPFDSQVKVQQNCWNTDSKFSVSIIVSQRFV